ncbi:MAG: tRNA (adenosine(37)-N6)-dimethylallyltransferase MiaA [Rhizobiales bacterium]|nr:tRNA (adenosine(37)-N6)-dimethylallyltransferase MiaA [Hyphomicrobiales bacterium]
MAGRCPPNARRLLSDVTKAAQKAVLIAGPTASGKSALALRVAERHGGLVVNADSMQVYRDLRFITARPTPGDEALAPHRLYGHVDAADSYSSGRWLVDAAAALDEAARTGRLPVVIGGTGLYFKLASEGIAAVPPIPSALKETLRRRLLDEGAPALHAELARRDPEGAAKVAPRDGSRIVRALEVLEGTGRPLRDWHRDNAPPLLAGFDAVRVFLAPDRDLLRSRIDARFDAMLEAGALDEVRALHARGLNPRLPAMKAHGVPWIVRHFEGAISLDDARREGKADTRRYAKRQFTWFRNQLADWPMLPADEAEAQIARALAD